MQIIKKSLENGENFKVSVYKNEVMKDGKVFSPSIHRRFLPTQYLSMVQGGYSLPASPLKFTWLIRRWLGLEISNIIRMKNTPSLENEYTVRMFLLGKNIFNYLMNKERLSKKLVYGRGVGRRDGYEWVYLVSEKWIYENIEDLYNSYLAMGCYYTITSLQAFGKLSGSLEGITKNGENISISLSDSGDTDKNTIKVLVEALRNDKVFRDSLSVSCLRSLNLKNSSHSVNGFYLKNEDRAIEKFKEFYIKEYKTRKVTEELLSKYNIPIVGSNKLNRSNCIQGLYVM